MLFRATTLFPDHEFAPRDTLERRRLLDYLDRPPTAGIMAWMVGPIGSGKSTIALQWANTLGRPVQYVSAMMPPFSPDYLVQPPDDLGKALENLLNACGDATREPSEEEISRNLNRVVSLSQSEPRVFILDDMQMIRRSAMEILQRLLIEALPELRIERALIISRTIDATVLGGLQALRTLRMVLPSALAFDQQEAEAAQQMGVFGSAMPEQVEDARIESSGWITGMLTSLSGSGGRTFGYAQFRNDVMNDLLLHQPPQILRVMIASAILPVNYLHIWERWFDHLEIPQWAIPSTIAQLPTTNDTDSQGGFTLAPAMKKALLDLRNISVSEESLKDLLTIAGDWYVENNEISAAASLAAENDLQVYLLRALKVLCIERAEKEDWSAIVDVLKLVPTSLLVEEPDLTFWYFHGLVEDNQWAEMKHIYDRVASTWSESSNPLELGRAHLVRSWNAYMLNRGEEALKQAEHAYTTLPADAHRERLWAAGTASITQSLQGYRQEARRWSAQANFEQTFLAGPSRWWHNNSGPIRYSWLAIAGMVNEAYEISFRQVRDLGGEQNENSARYLILMAQIDIERLDLDSAAELIQKSSRLVSDKYALRHHFRIAQANLYRASGDYKSALELLSAAQKATGQRFDQFARELFIRARLALDNGDVETAELYLSGAPSGDRAWPKNFGDAHPGLVRARLRYLNGRHDDAIAMAQSVATEASNRGHAQFAVAANATLAHIFHALDRVKSRDRAIEAATAADSHSEFHLSFIVDGRDIREIVTSGETEPVATQPKATTTPLVSSIDRLTNRELEVLSLVAQGLSNKQIADTMYISVSTVKNHLASAYDKLGTNNRRGATRIARDLGLIDR